MSVPTASGLGIVKYRNTHVHKAIGLSIVTYRDIHVPTATGLGIVKYRHTHVHKATGLRIVTYRDTHVPTLTATRLSIVTNRDTHVPNSGTPWADGGNSIKISFETEMTSPSWAEVCGTGSVMPLSCIYITIKPWCSHYSACRVYAGHHSRLLCTPN